MKLLDLFSGIGGFSLAASWVWGDELEIVAFCEIDKYCQKVLHKHWPKTPIIDDIRDLNEKTLTDSQFDGSSEIWQGIDLLTGGFPCQPFSVAGKRQGTADNRYLWPEMYRVIKEFHPRWIIGENVAGFVNMALNDCCTDLEAEGYEVQPLIIPACAVNAPHRRDRVWIVANSKFDRRRGENNGNEGKLCGALQIERPRSANQQQNVADHDRQCCQEQLRGHQLAETTGKRTLGWQDTAIRRQWATEPNVGRVAHGIPNRVDRLRGLGNAIVPQVAAVIMQAIKDIDKEPDKDDD